MCLWWSRWQCRLSDIFWISLISNGETYLWYKWKYAAIKKELIAAKANRPAKKRNISKSYMKFFKRLHRLNLIHEIICATCQIIALTMMKRGYEDFWKKAKKLQSKSSGWSKKSITKKHYFFIIVLHPTILKLEQHKITFCNVGKKNQLG
jgi:hypothetical protein